MSTTASDESGKPQARWKLPLEFGGRWALYVYGQRLLLLALVVIGNALLVAVLFAALTLPRFAVLAILIGVSLAGLLMLQIKQLRTRPREELYGTRGISFSGPRLASALIGVATLAIIIVFAFGPRSIIAFILGTIFVASIAALLVTLTRL